MDDNLKVYRDYMEKSMDCIFEARCAVDKTIYRMMFDDRISNDEINMARSISASLFVILDKYHTKGNIYE